MINFIIWFLTLGVGEVGPSKYPDKINDLYRLNKK